MEAATPFPCLECGRAIPCRAKSCCLYCGATIPPELLLSKQQHDSLQEETDRIKERTKNFHVPKYDLNVRHGGIGLGGVIDIIGEL